MDQFDIDFAKEQGEALRSLSNQMADLQGELALTLGVMETAARRISAACPAAKSHLVSRRIETIRANLNKCDFGPLVAACSEVSDHTLNLVGE